MVPTSCCSVVPLYGIKFRSENTLPQASCDDNKKAIGVPEIKIVAKVAGRICVVPVEVMESIAGGDEVAFVEAMKMGVPVLSPTAGIITSLLVKLDDVVAEGQTIAIHRKLTTQSTPQRLQFARTERRNLSSSR
jgi:biotin carboxyl carrier protein